MAKNNDTELLILQHPDETAHPLGTAIMANMSFKKSSLYVGENFDQLNELQIKLKNKNFAILYPHTKAVDISFFKAHSAKNNTKLDGLIILDGSWRKAKRIYNKSLTLRDLPLLALSKSLNSRYQIRKSPKNSFLSTFEAATYALNILDNNNYSDSLSVMDEQIKKHISFMGKKYQKFYVERATDKLE
jgi:DTW domain-containing protein YfiP